MHPTALLTTAANSRSARTVKGAPCGQAAALARCARPSGTYRIVRIIAVLVGSLILVLSLVDPLSGSEQFANRTAALGQEAPHE